MSKLTPPSRLVFLDVLRLVAAVQMVQGHSVAAVLAPAYRHGLAYAVWTFARGLTSVLFLTSAGLAFVLAEGRASEPRARRRRALRALRLVAIGYAMHAPLGLLVGLPLARTLASALVVDVLQCIGVSLLLLELLSAAAHDRQLRALLALGLAALCFGAAPLLAGQRFEGASLLLGNYVNTRHGSLFPLLPWAGYVFAGFGLGSLFLAQRVRLPWLLLASGLATLVVGLALLRIEPVLPLGVSPGYAAVKLGCVLTLAGALARTLRGVERLPRLLALLASETLFLYVSHVVLLYADGLGLAWQLGERHGPMFGVALALVLLVACGAAALGFRRLVRSLRSANRGSTRGAQLP